MMWLNYANLYSLLLHEVATIYTYINIYVWLRYNLSDQAATLCYHPCYSCCCASTCWLIKWKHFPCYWPFVRGIHRAPAKSPHKGQWRGALMFSLICTRINVWVNMVRLAIWDVTTPNMTSLWVDSISAYLYDISKKYCIPQMYPLGHLESSVKCKACTF